jgi:uncharacterized protein YjbK
MEKELKYKIETGEDYIKITNVLKNQYRCDELVQENYYYDTKDMLLLKNGSILRSRVEYNKVIITFKTLKSNKEGYFISDEIENITDVGKFRNVLSGKVYILNLCENSKNIVENIIKGDKLFLIGKIRNERQSFYCGDLVFELDRVDFGKGIFDYEIEVESQNEKEARDILHNLFNELNIKYKVQKKTKYQRFLEANNIKVPFEMKE